MKPSARMKFVIKVPKSAGAVVGTTEHRGMLFVATERHIYRLVRNKLVAIKFVEET
jgi:hypothetical protein